MAAVELNAHINPANPGEVVLKVGEMVVTPIGLVREPEDPHDEFNVIQESVGTFLASVLSGGEIPQMEVREHHYDEDEDDRPVGMYSKNDMQALLNTAQQRGLIDPTSADNLRREIDNL